ncbi:DUF819 family protein [uncultured Pseudoteredinibacter sp.]|uniref:DUF819 family protein n=1 Tax=uncultured Pseudoteredinibacter sp. TaxID=1641701 RepID=UPI002625A67A|nr:DUF819 family protein [uncultured Pseudoteredinibacter sp.]
MNSTGPLITNDAVSFGLLALILALIMHTANNAGPRWKRFYSIVPMLLICYLIPSLLNTFGVISSKGSGLWTIAKNYFLPAALVLMTLSIDLKAIMRLGDKAIIMFLVGTVGIVIGGPLAILIMSMFSPETVGGVGPEAVWRGLATLAGSWIGGGANQAAMLELYQYNPANYSAMVTVDIIVANIWMAFLLWGAGNNAKVDRWLGADTTAIDDVKRRLEEYHGREKLELDLPRLTAIFAIAFGTVGLCHLLGDVLAPFFKAIPATSESILANHFFWIVIVSTTMGLGLSFTRFNKLEGAGASKFGSLFIYLLVVIIGTKMDVMKIVEQPGLILVGIIWMSIHSGLLIIVAKIIRAPFFFLAVGSKANVGGAASAPIIAAAFHPSLAPVGVLLAVLGYALGTYGAMLCAWLMSLAAPV